MQLQKLICCGILEWDTSIHFQYVTSRYSRRAVNIVTHLRYCTYTLTHHTHLRYCTYTLAHHTHISDTVLIHLLTTHTSQILYVYTCSPHIQLRYCTYTLAHHTHISDTVCIHLLIRMYTHKSDVNLFLVWPHLIAVFGQKPCNGQHTILSCCSSPEKNLDLQ